MGSRRRGQRGDATFTHPGTLPPVEPVSPADASLLEDLERVQAFPRTVAAVPPGAER